MDIQAYVLVLGLCALVFWIFAKEIYDSKPHIKYENVNALRQGAVPIDIKRKKTGFKDSMHYKTTITFDDGFVYVSNKTDRVDHFATYSISLSEKLQREIMEDAFKAHHDTIMKRDLNKKKSPAQESHDIIQEQAKEIESLKKQLALITVDRDFYKMSAKVAKEKEEGYKEVIKGFFKEETRIIDRNTGEEIKHTPPSINTSKTISAIDPELEDEIAEIIKVQKSRNK